MFVTNARRRYFRLFAFRIRVNAIYRELISRSSANLTLAKLNPSRFITSWVTTRAIVGKIEREHYSVSLRNTGGARQRGRKPRSRFPDLRSRNS